MSAKSFSNSPFCGVNFGKTFTAGAVSIPEAINKIVRFKAIGETKFRLTHQPQSEILMSDKETDYFFWQGDITIISGSLNLMW